MSKAIRLAFLALLLAAAPALAEDFVNSATPTKNAPGVVILCRTSASLYLPCDSTTPVAVNVVSGGGTGGTSSSFGATFPGTGTAIGLKNGANMVNGTADGSGNLNINCAVGCSSSGATFGAAFPTTGGAIGLSDGTNMVAQFTASNLADNVTGANMGAMGAWVWSGAGWYRFPGSNLGVKVVGSIASGSAKSGFPVQTGAVFNTTQPTVTTGQVVESQATARGAHIVATGVDAFAVNATQAGTWNVTNVSGTVSLPTGAATAAKQPALGTAGSPSADVLSVQGVTSGTALNVTSAAITSIPSTAAEGSHVLKASAGTLVSVYATAGASSGWLMVFNATSAPADGAVSPRHCVPIGANGVGGVNFGGGPGDAFATGITAVFSTTGCFTKTISATAFISGSVQ